MFNLFNGDNLIDCDNISNHTVDSFEYSDAYNQCRHPKNTNRYQYLCGTKTNLYKNKGPICVGNFEDCNRDYLLDNQYFKLPCRNKHRTAKHNYDKVRFQDDYHDRLPDNKKRSIRKPMESSYNTIVFSIKLEKIIQELEQKLTEKELNMNKEKNSKQILETINKKERYYDKEIKEKIKEFLKKYGINNNQTLYELLKEYLIEAEAMKLKYLELLNYKLKNNDNFDNIKTIQIDNRYKTIVDKGKIIEKQELLDKYDIQQESNISVYLYQDIIYFVDTKLKLIIDEFYTYEFIIKHGVQITEEDNQLLYNFLKYKFQGVEHITLPDELKSLQFGSTVQKNTLSFYKYNHYIYILDITKKEIIYQEPTAFLLKLKGIFIDVDKLDTNRKSLYSTKKEDNNYLFNNKVYTTRLNMIINERDAF